MSVLRDRLQESVLALTLMLCAVPYLGMLLYLFVGVHGGTRVVSVPPPVMLLGLALVGGVLPLTGLGIVLTRLIRDRRRFRLGALLEAYASLILIFASWYALLQASSAEPAFAGLSLLWESGRELTFAQHTARMHAMFLDTLYLSVMTITTVGYGDLVPLSPWAKLVTALEGVLGIGFVGVALGHYFSVCVHRR